MNIYLITCKCPLGDGYVGKTKDIYERTKHHRYNLSNTNSKEYNMPAYKHFRKCGMTKDDIFLQTIDFIPRKTGETDQEFRTRTGETEEEWMAMLKVTCNTNFGKIRKEKASQKKQ
tara:strand:+ start:1163 stop:1510 length:348 start_codon:yes stop_codon:yes gene_type:complete